MCHRVLFASAKGLYHHAFTSLQADGINAICQPSQSQSIQNSKPTRRKKCKTLAPYGLLARTISKPT